MRLIGPDGALPADVERPLLALATHPQIGAPMFRAMKFGYRASYAFGAAAPATAYRRRPAGREQLVRSTWRATSRSIENECGRSTAPPPDWPACTTIELMSSRRS